MSFEDEDESLEHTLLVVREVHVYKIPPRLAGGGGYKCAEWLVSSKIWSGRLRVVGKKDVCELRLEDTKTGELFAACAVHPGKREASVESAVDSSRYFVLKIEDGTGKHAFIGLGFNERNEAFDFNVALTDHEKHHLHEKDGKDEWREETAGGVTSSAPSKDFKLKEGETIRISVKTPASSSSNTAKKPLVQHQGLTVPLIKPPAAGAPLLAPPPGTKAHPIVTKPIDNSSGKPTSHSQPALQTSTKQPDAFADFSQMQSSISEPQGSNSSQPAGWASF